MKQNILNIAILSATSVGFLVLVGCATTGSLPNEIMVFTFPDGKVQLGNIVSIYPPTVGNWKKTHSGYGVIVWQQQISSNHSSEANIRLIEQERVYTNQEEIVSLARVSSEKFAASPSHKNMSFEVSPDSRVGPYCALSRYEFDDYEAVDRGDKSFLRQKAHDLLCLHPKWPRVLILAKYSECGAGDDMSESFDQDATRFIRGFKLEGLPQAH